MGQLADVLYPLPDRRRTAFSSLAWWESRRLAYNTGVGAAGLVTLASIYFFFSLPPMADGPPPLAGALIASAVYAVAANVCFSFGWAAEQLARAIWGRSAPDLGPLLFREGLIFSVGLTLLPALLSGMFWALRVISEVIG